MTDPAATISLHWKAGDPGPDSRAALLEQAFTLLEARGVKALFICSAETLALFPALEERIRLEGHGVAPSADGALLALSDSADLARLAESLGAD